MKQKVFSWNDKFSVFDENGGERYYAEGEIFTWGKKLHLYDSSGQEAAFIKQKLLGILPTHHYIIETGGYSYTVVKELTFLTPCFHVEGTNWRLKGDFFTHEYSITDDERIILRLSRHWFTFGDSYELDIPDDRDEILALAVALAIDCVNADQDRRH
jgi:uncharacterized protein YxjI